MSKKKYTTKEARRLAGLAFSKAWREKHLEYKFKWKQYQKKFYEKNKKKIYLQQKIYRRKHLAQYAAQHNNWIKRNPERAKAIRKRASAVFFAKQIAYKAAHPELYYKTKSGKYHKLPMNPVIKEIRRKRKSKENWQKLKKDAVYIEAHRKRSYEYWKRKQLEKAREKLIYALIRRMNQKRIQAEIIKLLNH